MTPTRAIYVINQSIELSKAQKCAVLEICETEEESEIERIIEEVADGQRRLF